MLKITLSHYTRDGVREHTVLVGGNPIIRETTDEAVASSRAQKAFVDHHGSATLTEWDGDTQEEKTLATKPG